MKDSLPKILCTSFLFCAAAAIPSDAQTFTSVYNFCSQPNCTDGSGPEAALVQATDGNFYGTTTGGGNTNGACSSYGCGTVFKMAPTGALTVLHSFTETDGWAPVAGLLQANDGDFYGTTTRGGNTNGACSPYGCGTVFKMSSSGVFTTLYYFCSQPNCEDGESPSPLVQANDGSLYGSTGSLGGHGEGTVFKITPAGQLTTLYSFCSQPNCTDGGDPNTSAGLVQATDGNFYGTTYGGGTSSTCFGGCGTVFKITPTGALTTLYSFCSQPNCADGYSPFAGLVQATDGNFYGTTGQGGTAGGGTAFKITPSGTLTTLYDFCTQSNCSPFPLAPLVQASDGNLYGTTSAGGNNGGGTVFKITPAGQLTTVYNFCSQPGCSDGEEPFAALMQASDGNLYGTASGGGANGNGSVFSLTGPNRTGVQFIPVTPCRVVDTRQGSPIQGGTWEVFVVSQLGNCNIPANSSAYSLNVTVVPRGRLGYLTIWPAERPQPNVSTMNSPDGRVKANAAIVPAGASGGVSVYVSNTTDVILDIDGYFATPGDSTLAFYPLAPCRIVDTRNTNGDLGGPFLTGNQERNFPILESNCIPTGIIPTAYSFNVTAVPHPAHQRLGYLTVWPAGEQQPVVSTLNNPTGTNVANAAIVLAGDNGAVAVYPNDDTDLLIDTNGYFAASGSRGLSLYTVAPCRVLDTRSVGSGQPFQGELTVNVVGSACAPSSAAQAYVFNATVVPPGAFGYLTLWPDGENQPLVSTLNAIDGAITSNMAIVPTNNGSIDAYASALTQLILDISSYFAP